MPLRDLIKETLRFFKGQEKIDAKTRELAALLNLSTSAVSIQRLARRGSLRTLYRARLREGRLRIELAFTPDWMQVCLVALKAPPGTGPGPVRTLLRAHGLECREEVLAGAMASLRKGGRARRIARGRPPRSISCALPFLPPGARAEQVMAHFQQLVCLPASEWLADTVAAWVRPGQVLSEPGAEEEGRQGADVFGRPLPAPPAAPPPLAGPGVSGDEDGRLLAEIPGYAYLHEGRIGVVDPLHIDAGGFEAAFAFAPCPGGKPPEREEIAALLAGRGMVCGVDEQAVERLALCFVQGGEPGLQPLARGRPAEPGRDGEIYFDVDCAPQPGKVLPDGRIDFRETCFGLDVPKGVLLARLLPARQGSDGFTIFGEHLKAEDGRPACLQAGPNVEVAEAEGETLFHAAIDGRVSLRGQLLQVHETLHIAADVDYSTGNIDFSGDVLVAGSVKPGFCVRARGSIAVQGQVEAGASLEAEGDIAVCGGVVGEHTLVQAGGSFSAKFVQDAQVRAGGDVNAGSYLFNARVRSEGRVVVHSGQGRRSGSIAGGCVLAARGIQARFAGSPSGTATELVAGVDPAAETDLRTCEARILTCRQEQERLRQHLGLEQITLPHLRRLLASAPPARREQLGARAQRWKELDRQIRRLAERRAELRGQLVSPSPEAVLAIEETIFPGVRLRVGEHTALVQLEMRDTQLTSATWTEKLVLQNAA